VTYAFSVTETIISDDITIMNKLERVPKDNRIETAAINQSINLYSAITRVPIGKTFSVSKA